MKNKTRTWLIIFFSVVILGLLSCAALVIIVDPFFQYHKPLETFPYQLDNQLTQNPGLAKQLDYDSVLLGSSMTLNFESDWFQETAGLNLLKLPYNAATPKNQDIIMNQIWQHKDSLKEVYLGVDLLPYTEDVDETAYYMPETYYDNNVLNDAEYLWNLDVLMDYIVSPVLTHKAADSINEIYCKGYYPGTYDEANALDHYDPPTSVDPYVPKDAYLNIVKENLDINIRPYIESHPETHFTVFFPPYSILFYHELLMHQDMDARMEEAKYMMEFFMQFDNVSLFYFANAEDIICNLNNYRDYTHYSKEICRYLTDCFNDGTMQIDETNYIDALEKTREIALNYDFTIYGFQVP